MKTKFFQNNKEQGVVLIDAIIAIAIISIAFVALLGVAEASIKLSTLLQKETDALLLAQEEIEAVRSFRDGKDWSVDGLGFLSTGVSYYANLNTGSSPAVWEFVLGEETTGIFTRKIIIENVMRDVNGNIVESGGSNDDDTRKVTVTVEWEGGSLQLVAYFTNWQ